MNIRQIIPALLRRTKLNRILQKTIPLYEKIKIDKRKLMTYEEALRELNQFSSNPMTSAITTEAKKDTEAKWDLDIIIPCYNVENTVRKCLDSCLKQETDFKFRLIIINDGSIDSTATIIKEYVNRPNVLVIHQENKGFSGARNTGLDASDSEYIMFVDSDDFLPKHAIQALMSVAKWNDAEIVGGGYTLVDKDGVIHKNVHSEFGCIDPRKRLGGQPWAKIFKSSYFDRVRFPEKYWYEDSIFSQLIYPMVEKNGGKTYGVSEIVYNYYSVNPTSITYTSRYEPKCIDSYYITESLYVDRKKVGLITDQEYYEYILRMVKLTYSRTQFVPLKVKEALFVSFKEFIVKNFENYDTEVNEHKYLERAIREGNYAMYRYVLMLL